MTKNYLWAYGRNWCSAVDAYMCSLNWTEDAHHILTSKVPSNIITDDSLNLLFLFFSEELRLGISYEL